MFDTQQVENQLNDCGPVCSDSEDNSLWRLSGVDKVQERRKQLGGKMKDGEHDDTDHFHHPHLDCRHLAAATSVTDKTSSSLSEFFMVHIKEK